MTRRRRRAGARRRSVPHRGPRVGHASRAKASPTSPPRRFRPRPAGRSTPRAAWGARTGSSAISCLVADPKHREEGLLRDLHRPHHLHAHLAFLLLLLQLVLSGDVHAVALLLECCALLLSVFL